MSITYRVREGDTLESLSRRFYGTENEVRRIETANPGLNPVEPLQQGAVLYIPRAPRVAELADLADDEVALVIGGQRFRYWSEFTFTTAIDEIPTVAFSAPFTPDEAAFRQQFRPFSYAPVSVQVGSDRLFTGTLMNVAPNVSDTSKSVDVNAYSAPGVLADCNASAADYPLEFDFLDLKQIAEILVEPFGLSIRFDGDPGVVFEQVEIGPGTTVWAFLVSLAEQRDYVIGATDDGRLWFRQSLPRQAPVARLQGGIQPLSDLTPQFNPQRYFSHVTGIEQLVIGVDNFGQFTVQNPRLSGAFRPSVFTVPDSFDIDIETATRSKAARFFAEAATWTARVGTWRTPNGQLWRPGDLITIAAPDAMIYTDYNLLVRRVELIAAGNTREAVLTLTIPEAFSGELPERLPWD